MFNRSIIMKLSLAMIALVLVIMLAVGTAQSKIIEKMYYDQQVEHLTSQGKNIAVVLNSSEDVAGSIKLLSETTHNNIMYLNREGSIEECHGMGVNMSRGMHMGGGEMRGHQHRKALNSQETGGDINARNHGKAFGGKALNERQLEGVMRGETAAYRGPSHF